MSKSGLMQKKIGVLRKKCDDLTSITEKLHLSMHKIEELFIKDIAQREKNVKQLNQGLDDKMKRTGHLDMSEVDAIFDEIEREESSSFISALFMNGVNILMLATIGSAAFVYHKMNEMAGKRF